MGRDAEGMAMKRRCDRVLMAVFSVILLVQAGCLRPADVGAIAEGQLISFVNALINTATSDAIRAGLGS